MESIVLLRACAHCSHVVPAQGLKVWVPVVVHGSTNLYQLQYEYHGSILTVLVL